MLIVAKRSGGRFAELVKSRGSLKGGFRRRRQAGRRPVVALALAIQLLTAAFVLVQSSQPAEAHLEAHTNFALGIDRCGYASPQALQAFWNGTPFYSVGVYIGGEMAINVAHCYIPDSNWVTAVRNEGWGIVFIWDGLQAPCSGNTYKMSADPNTSYSQGRDAAWGAYTKANGLGRDEYPTVFYLDIEGNGYDGGNVSCRNAVNAFIRGWSDFHAQTPADRSGVYSNSSAAIKGLVQGQCWQTRCPDYIWMANWNGSTTVWGDPYVSDDYWWPHGRMHQYRGGHSHTYNGVTLNPVDDDCNLAAVAGGVMNEDVSGHNNSQAAVKAAHPSPTCRTSH